MAHITAAVYSNADLHERLLASLASLDDASTISLQATYELTSKQPQLAELDKRIKGLVVTTAKEQKEFEKIRDSKLKYTLMGKGQEYDQKLEKEEKEYYSVLEELIVVRAERERVQASIESATAARDAVKDAAADHTEVRKQLSDLYASVFSGHSTGFAGEDAAERAVHRAEEEYRNAQVPLLLQSQVTSILADASRCISSLMRELESARVGFGITTSEAQSPRLQAARNAIISARASASHIKDLISIAQRTAVGSGGVAGHTQVEDVGEVEIHELGTDIYELNTKFLGRLRDAKTSAMMVNRKLDGEMKKANQRLDLAGEVVKEKISELEKARDKLFDFRKAAWVQVLAMGPAEQPPEYGSRTRS